MKRIALVILTCLLFSSTALAAQRVELEMWTFVEDHAQYYRLKAEEFNALHPDIDFVLNVSTFPNEQMHDKLNIALLTGIGAPDIADVEKDKFPGLLTNSADQLVDLTPLIDRYRDKIVEARLTLYTRDGITYGIPTHIGTGVIFYNKEIFDAAGINVDDIETWEDYIEAGKKITQDLDGDGEIDVYMTAVPSLHWWVFNIISRQLGSNYFDEQGNVILDRPENVRALQMLQDFVYEHKIAEVVSGYNNVNFYNGANSGRYASILPMPQWYMTRITNFMPDLEGKVVVRPIPAWEPGGVRSSSAGGTGTVITKHCRNIDVAMEFLEFAKLSKEGNVDIWTKLGFDPIRRDVCDEPELYQPIPFFGNEIVMNTIKGLQDDILPFYLSDKYPLVRDIMTEEVLFNAIENRGDVQKLLEDAARKLRSAQ